MFSKGPVMPQDVYVQDPLSTHNERVRLFSSFLNAVGLGLIGFSILRPVSESATVGAVSLWWGSCGLAFHALAHYILRHMRKRDES